MSRIVYFQFESGKEGSTHVDCIDGPYAAETWQELKAEGTALLQSDRVPPEVLGLVNWYGLWNDVQYGEDGFFPVTLRWPGRWVRVSWVSRQQYEDAMEVERIYEESYAANNSFSKKVA